MSALAKFALLSGKTVSGSDVFYNNEVVTLNQWGADVWIGHEPERLVDVDLVVYTVAVPDSDPELVYARQMGIPAIARHHFLKEISKNYETVIAVAGTHGKTTTTGMLASIFKASGLPFTAHIGGNIKGGIGNLIYKGDRFFITEACEYKKSLLGLNPHIAVVLNVEEDHPDTYPTLCSLYSTFDKFIENIKENGVAVVCAETDYFNKLKCKDVHIVSYGYEGNITYTFRNVEQHKNGHYRFLIYEKETPIIQISLNVAGIHNVYNATAAFAAARHAGVPFEAIARGLANFKGVERRFDERGSLNGARVFVDYAHHPNEISASIMTAANLKPKRLFIVFQPHTYSRTKKFFDEFVASLQKCDYLYIFKEYAAREDATEGATAKDLCIGAKAMRNENTFYFDNIIALGAELDLCLSKGDILLILGAGDIDRLADILTIENCQ